MKIRIDKMLSNMGVGTRSGIKQIVREGRVECNGSTVKKASMLINTDFDEIFVDSKLIQYEKNIYLMLHKPAGIVSATEDSRDNTVIDLVPEEFAHYKLFPVGRLDKDTEGLVLLTNDGKLSYNLLSPKKHVDKTYYVELEKNLQPSYAAEMRKGIELDDGYVTMPAVFEECGKDLNACRLTIREGKYHQVKRMFEALGNRVTYLKRISMGTLTLDDSLKPGEMRRLTEDELNCLTG